MKNGQITNTEELPSTVRWWNKRSTLERRLIIATVVSALILLLVLIVYLIVSHQPAVCTTSTCVRTSMELLNYVNIKIDPCEDFYQFSCGNFLRNTNLDNRNSRSVKDIIVDEIKSQIRNILEHQQHQQQQQGHIEDLIAFNLAKKFYRACMNATSIEAEGLKGIKQIFEQMGGWPILNGQYWRENEFDWKNVVYKLRQIGINFKYFVMLTVQRDKTDLTRYILNIEKPYSATLNITENIRNLYADYMTDIAIIFGANRERAMREQQELMEFLLKLAKISVESSSNKSTPYNVVSLSELQHEYPGIPWLEYINKILKPHSEITYDDTVSVAEPLYLKKLLNLLRTTPKRTVANFMCWQVLQHLINYLPSAILERTEEYHWKVNVGNVMKQPRWSMCVDSTIDRLNTVISAVYIGKYFNDDIRHRVLSIVRNIKYQFRNDLLALDWFDEKTKKIAIEKVVSSVEEIPTYEDLIQESRFYRKVDVLVDQLLGLVLQLDYINTNIHYGKLHHRTRNRVSDSGTSLTNLDINYIPKENILNIPVGAFQGLLYQKDRPQYMNYGMLGTIIAHELYHIIVEAKYRELQGELRSWWSPHTLLNYQEKLQCLSGQYRNSSRFQLNYSSTSDQQYEDMADLIGLKVSYNAYNNWMYDNQVEARLPGLNYSPNQLYWISSVLHHCTRYKTEKSQNYYNKFDENPKQLHINTVLRNIDEFAFDFRCPIGSRMNPSNKCHIW